MEELDFVLNARLRSSSPNTLFEASLRGLFKIESIWDLVQERLSSRGLPLWKRQHILKVRQLTLIWNMLFSLPIITCLYLAYLKRLD